MPFFFAILNKSLLLLSCSLGITLAVSLPSLAEQQIIPDNRFGTRISWEDRDRILVHGGQRPDNGRNLFHSFRELNVRRNQSLYFNSPEGVENIISRVIGSDASNIRGILGIQGGDSTNLFLINPNGIIFGPHARLDIRGSFVATTAQHLTFEDRSLFSTDPELDSTLTVNVPFGLQFGRFPGVIVNRSGTNATMNGADEGLRVSMGESIVFAGGSIRMPGGTVTAPGGRIELGSIGSNDQVGVRLNNRRARLVPNDTLEFQDIYLSDEAFLTTTHDGSGDIHLFGRHIRLSEGSQIESITTNHHGGEISLRASESIRMRNRTATASSSRIRILSETEGTGNAGNIQLSTRHLVMDDGAIIRTTTEKSGNGGLIDITATDSISIQGSFSQDSSRIQSDTAFLSRGNSGGISIHTGRLRLQETQISTSTSARGQAGQITIRASEVILEGGVETGIFSQSRSGASGNGGSVNIYADQMAVRDGGTISASTINAGNGGSLNLLISDHIVLTGSNLQNGSIVRSSLQTAVRATDDFDLSELGNAGNINITTQQLTVKDDAEISVSGIGAGEAGNLIINADFIEIDSGNLVALTESGDRADIRTRDFGLLLMRNRSEISARASNDGDGGNVIFNSPDGFIFAPARGNNNILASAEGGDGGLIRINALDVLGFVERRPENTSLNVLDASAGVGGNDGVVEVNTPDVDPEQGAIELPSTLVDVSNLIDQNVCQATEYSEFVTTGRGGIPLSPSDILSDESIWEDRRLTYVDGEPENFEELDEVATAPHNTSESYFPKNEPSYMTESEQSLERVIEAHGWIVNSEGAIELVASASSVSPGHNSLGCG